MYLLAFGAKIRIFFEGGRPLLATSKKCRQKSKEYFEIGQFTEESKTNIIPIIKINKDTMEVEYAKYMELVEQILCIKI